MTPLRGLEAITLMVGAIGHLSLVVGCVAAIGSLFTGLVAASQPGRTIDVRLASATCPRCSISSPDVATEGLRRRSVCRACARRRDDVGSAVIHAGLFAVIVAAAAAHSGPLGSLAVVVVWPGLVWDGIAEHELGHAIAAAVMGRRVTSVDIGKGLPLVSMKRVHLYALPFGGRTKYDQNDTTTRLREAFIAAAGPAANLMVAVALALVAARIANAFLWIIAFSHATMGISNLLPQTSKVHSREVHSDGARIWRLLRPTAT